MTVFLLKCERVVGRTWLPPNVAPLIYEIYCLKTSFFVSILDPRIELIFCIYDLRPILDFESNRFINTR